MKSLLRLGLFAVLIFTLAACSQTAQPLAAPFISDIGESDVTENTTTAEAVIAELETATGSTLVFIDESLSVEGSGVGVLELTAAGQQPALATLQKFEPSALELFLAFAAKNASAPERLVEAHREQVAAHTTGVRSEPRRLELETIRPTDLSAT